MCAAEADAQEKLDGMLWATIAAPPALVVLPTAAVLPAALYANGEWWWLYLAPSVLGVLIGVYRAGHNVLMVLHMDTLRSQMDVSPGQRLALILSGAGTMFLAVLTLPLWPLIVLGPRWFGLRLPGVW
jgi:hypothetical protein